MVATGGILKQIVYATAGFSNQCSLVTATATTGNANTVITDIGLLWFQSTPASLSVQLQDPSGTWTDVMVASATVPQLMPSDGMNLRLHSASTSTNRSASYYIVQ
jgi:hypothetical protein